MEAYFSTTIGNDGYFYWRCLSKISNKRIITDTDVRLIEVGLDCFLEQCKHERHDQQLAIDCSTDKVKFYIDGVMVAEHYVR